MPLRSLILLSLFGLLIACGSNPSKSVAQAPTPQQPQNKARTANELGPLPATQRELRGSLDGAPTGAEVELALLVTDERGRPQRLLASSKLTGTNQRLPFRLRFNPEAFPAGARVELRARASQSGQLILRLPAQPVLQATTQDLGPLQLLKAP